MSTAKQRGYFGFGAERISKPMNLGNLMRSAHAFGASFTFTVDANRTIGNPLSDTSNSPRHLPYYAWKSVAEMQLPRHCQLVGVEFLDEATELPSFRHPLRAAYVLGSERGSLSPGMLAKCDHVVKIPTAFCINLAVAGAIIMYDRVRSLGRFPPPPVGSRGPVEALAAHVHGKPVLRREDEA
jgi:tRNA G18 (ribose-2'-O)-methylase SpoU